MAMTLLVVVGVRDGIVLASDSRQIALATLTQEVGPTKGIPKTASIVETDSVTKIFLAPKNVAIAHHNIADAEGVPLTEYIQSFIVEKLSTDTDTTVDRVPQMLLNYFKAKKINVQAFFYVCGYVKGNDGKLDQQIWHVDLQNATFERSNKPNAWGASYGGEADIIQRMTGPTGLLNKSGELVQKFEHWPIYWQDFTLQDAIDYAIFAIRATIGMIGFQIRQKSVGGPIDVLVIRPDKEAAWFQQKQLHV